MKIKTIATGTNAYAPETYYVDMNNVRYVVSLETYLIITAILNIGKENA